MKNLLLTLILLSIYQTTTSQCTQNATGFGNNSVIPAYNISGDISITLNNDNTFTLGLGSNFNTASGPDVRAYLVNSNGLSDAGLASSLIADLENIAFGLTSATGAQSYTVPIPVDKDIRDFDKVFFYCLEFNAFWDFGDYTPFSTSNCGVLNTDDKVLDNLKIHPNPTSNYIRIGGINKNSAELHIFDTLGKPILKQSNNLGVIDISHLNSGVYILRVQVENKSRTQKIVIQ